MKLVGVLLGFLLICFLAEAQEFSLPTDERGKFILYELVEAKGLSRIEIGKRAYSFLKDGSKVVKLKSNQGDSVYRATGKFIISKTLLVMSHPSGEIVFNFEAEIRDQKFRFWLTDFNFIPYQRDRYGNFVATTAKGTPLERNPGKLNTGQWKEYQLQTAKFAQQFAIDFREYLLLVDDKAPASPAKKTIVGKVW
ncbi:MAG: hypothetical protein EOO90_18015 [Pedobacter sp.]|nr:MAG: hypothetical protein EOO90_18015 [Pedobacter sp.]